MSTHSFSNKRNNPGRNARKERADERAANHVCSPDLRHPNKDGLLMQTCKKFRTAAPNDTIVAVPVATKAKARKERKHLSLITT